MLYHPNQSICNSDLRFHRWSQTDYHKSIATMLGKDITECPYHLPFTAQVARSPLEAKRKIHLHKTHPLVPRRTH